MSDLSRRARVAAMWSFGDVLARQVAQFATAVVMARLLMPEDFGTIAIATLSISIATVFVDSGLAQALIQKKVLADRDVASAFWFNILMGAVTAGVVVLASGSIASYFAKPELRGLLRLMACNAFLFGAQNVHRAMLTKALRLRVLAVSSVASTLISGLAAVALAWAGFGVWSLAWQSIILSAVSGAIVMWVYRIPRVLRAGTRELADLFRYGSWIVGGVLLGTLGDGYITVLIGKSYSFRDLGFYLRAQGTRNYPMEWCSSSLERVIFPTLSEANDDHARLVRGARRAIALMMFANVPAMLVLALTAGPLVTFLFGSHWAPAAPYLTILCIAGVFWPVHVVNVQALLAAGRSKLFFWLDLIKVVLAILITLGASAFGLPALAWAQVVISVMAWVVNARYPGQVLHYGFKAQLRDVWSLLLAGAVAAGAALGVARPLGLSGLADLVVIPLVLLAAFGLMAWTFKLPGFQEALDVVRGHWPGRLDARPQQV